VGRRVRAGSDGDAGRRRQIRRAARDHPAMPALSFQRLCDVVEAAGAEVRVERAGDGTLVLRLVDFGRCRSVAVPVPRSFDAAVRTLCCSLALAADIPGFTGEGPALAAAWPELAELGRATAVTTP
jgi:hypothetical protein